MNIQYICPRNSPHHIAYIGKKQNQIISKKERTNCDHERGYQADPLLKEQEFKNTKINNTS